MRRSCVVVFALCCAARAAAQESTSVPATITTTAGTLAVETQYIPGVVESAMGWSASDPTLQPALEACAIAARSRLCRYLNANGPSATVDASLQPWSATASPRAMSAASATAGQVMWRGGYVVDGHHARGAWPLDAAGAPFGPAAYGYPYASWTALRDAWIADPAGVSASLSAYPDPASWTTIFVTNNAGLAAGAVQPTVAAPASVWNRGGFGQTRALWLAAAGTNRVSILRAFYGLDVHVVGAGPILAVDISHWSETLSTAEVAGMYAFGVRHVIVGTQNATIATQQLQKCIEGGLTVDAYVWLHWNQSMTTQVSNALSMCAPYPIGRMWLDVEESASGYSSATLIAKINEAIAACGSLPCGIYTGKGWWQTYVANTTAFVHVPLWYARYDMNPSLATWYASNHCFGGWAAPMGKQFSDMKDHNGDGDTNDPWEGRCAGVVVDYNTMYVSAAPIGPAPAPVPPPAPTGLSPDGGVAIPAGAVTLAWSAEAFIGREIRVETSTNGTTWSYYATWSQLTGLPTYTFAPAYSGRWYRWRVKVKNSYGWGAVSAWATFWRGTAATPPAPSIVSPSAGATVTSSPVAFDWSDAAGATAYQAQALNGAGATVFDATGTASSASVGLPAYGGYTLRVRAQNAAGWGPWASVAVTYASSPPPPPPPPPGGPTGLTPDGGVTVSTASVTLSCAAVAGATSYQFEIEYQSGTSWVAYTTYTTATNSKTFWPTLHGRTYRWRVRAMTGGTWGAWSAHATFYFV